ncbi:MAG: PAN domain-containing protein [Myxococcota bacterium]
MSTSDRYGLGLLLFSTAVCAQSTLVLERSTDRWGADFSATTAVSGEQCASICLANSACAAFTWQDNAGSGQPTMCWLKGVGTVPTTNSAFVSGAKGNVPRLSVVVANMNGVDNLPLYGVPSADWKTRLSRFAGIVAASGGPPDILALSEVTGWQWCWGEWRVFDYDVFDLVMSGLRDRTGVT